MSAKTSQSASQPRYSVQDYLQWPDDLRCELIRGIIYDMSPAPALDHQRVSRGLSYHFEKALLECKNKGSGGNENCSLL